MPEFEFMERTRESLWKGTGFCQISLSLDGEKVTAPHPPGEGRNSPPSTLHSHESTKFVQVPQLATKAPPPPAGEGSVMKGLV